MSKQTRPPPEYDLARDLAACELAQSSNTVKPRSRAGRHRKPQPEAVRDATAADGVAGMTDAELLASLEGEF